MEEARMLGRYKVVRPLGKGGMASVYLADDPTTGAQVVIKLLPPQSSPDVAVRFSREIKAIAALDHPAVVRVIDHLVDPETTFFVMPYLPAIDLRRWLVDKRTPPAGAVAAAPAGPPPDGLPAPIPLPKFAIPNLRLIVLDAAAALGHCHKHGIVHRDVKPENILVLTETGRGVLSDFGLAAVSTLTHITGTQQLLGTVLYMSPEQLTGADVGPESDQYQLALMLYEALAGRLPLLADTPLGSATRRAAEPMTSITDDNPEISPQLADFLIRALSPEPADRFTNMEEFVKELEATPFEPRKRPMSGAIRVRPATGAFRLGAAGAAGAVTASATLGNGGAAPLDGMPPGTTAPLVAPIGGQLSSPAAGRVSTALRAPGSVSGAQRPATGAQRLPTASTPGARRPPSTSGAMRMPPPEEEVAPAPQGQGKVVAAAIGGAVVGALLLGLFSRPPARLDTRSADEPRAEATPVPTTSLAHSLQSIVARANIPLTLEVLSRDLRTGDKSKIPSKYAAGALRPVLREIEDFKPLGPKWFADRAVPWSARQKLYDSLVQLMNLEAVMVYEKVPLPLPVLDILGPAMSPSHEDRLADAKEWEIELPDKMNKVIPRYDSAVAGYNQTMAVVSEFTKKSKRVTELVWTINLKETAKLTRAQLALSIESLGPTCYLTVDINGRGHLAMMAVDHQMIVERRPRTLYHTFDPALLQDGMNRLVVGLEVAPGWILSRGASSAQVLSAAIKGQ